MGSGHDRLGERLADRFNAAFLARDLERTLARRGGREVRIRVDVLGDGWPNDFKIARLHGGYQVTLSALAHRRFVVGSRHFLRAYLSWMDATSPDVREISINGSDGDRPSRAVFAASAPPGPHVPIPDPHFWLYEGFRRERALGASALDWDSRSDDVVWRGLGNGAGRLSLDRADRDDLTVVPRLRMCMLLAEVPGADVRVVGINEDGGAWSEPARQSGLGARTIPAETWLGRKFAIDIDGQANTWSNLLVRMLFGCCVLKVNSAAGFRQWYYDRLRPFEHYIPVKADMSDFVEKIDWARSHPSEARAIAEGGRRFAQALDFEAGRRDAIELIEANWNKPAA